ncbi:hypothetical protein GT2_16_01130 [Parageobacillus thermoglucosidasius NBRC 107763]|nr:hypothetical protein GT2_16_01130 [Parageobacillus thermoglucosidasius NBRC 107763]
MRKGPKARKWKLNLHNNAKITCPNSCKKIAIIKPIHKIHISKTVDANDGNNLVTMKEIKNIIRSKILGL